MGVFDGKVAIITGAGRGLGRDYARFFADDGAAVVLADVDGNAAEASATELKQDGARTMGVQVDVASKASAEAMAAAVLTGLGRIDVLVNNAGIWGDLQNAFDSILDVDPDYWDLVMGVNLKGALLCSSAVVPAMTAQGWGRIVNISSIGSRMAGGVYGVSKLALNQLTFAISGVVGGAGITCNAVAPGTIANDATKRQVPAEAIEQLVLANHIKRAGTSKDMYGVIKWLCTDDAEWFTGQTVYPNGGFFSVF